jgi:hypothetical protein
MELLLSIILLVALFVALSAAFGAESREDFSDHRVRSALG